MSEKTKDELLLRIISAKKGRLVAAPELSEVRKKIKHQNKRSRYLEFFVRRFGRDCLGNRLSNLNLADFSDDRELLFAAINAYYLEAFEVASEDLKHDENFVRIVLQRLGGRIMRNRSELFEKYFNKKKYVLIIVASNCDSYGYFPNKYQKDLDVIKAAISVDVNVYEKLANNLRERRDIILTLLKYHKWYLRKHQELFYDDKEALLLSVLSEHYLGHNQAIYQGASPRLQNDQEVIFRFLDNEYCPERDVLNFSLQNDKEFLQVIMKKYGAEVTLKIASLDLLNDASFIEEIAEFDISAYRYFPERFQQEKDFAFALIRRSINYFPQVHPAAIDQEICDYVIEKDVVYAIYFPERILRKKEVYLAIARKYVNAELVWSAGDSDKQFKMLLDDFFEDKNLRMIIKESFLASVDEEARSLNMPNRLIGDLEFITELIEADLHAIKFVPYNLQAEIGILLKELR